MSVRIESTPEIPQEILSHKWLSQSLIPSWLRQTAPSLSKDPAFESAKETYAGMLVSLVRSILRCWRFKYLKPDRDRERPAYDALIRELRLRVEALTNYYSPRSLPAEAIQLVFLSNELTLEYKFDKYALDAIATSLGRLDRVVQGDGKTSEALGRAHYDEHYLKKLSSLSESKLSPSDGKKICEISRYFLSRIAERILFLGSLNGVELGIAQEFIGALVRFSSASNGLEADDPAIRNINARVGLMRSFLNNEEVIPLLSSPLSVSVTSCG